RQRLARQLLRRKEHSVLLAPQHGNQISRRIGRLRLKREAFLLRGPLNRGSGAEERAFEVLGHVLKFCHLENAVPFHRARYSSAHRKDRRNLRKGKTQTAGKSQSLRQ